MYIHNNVQYIETSRLINKLKFSIISGFMAYTKSVYDLLNNAKD